MFDDAKLTHCPFCGCGLNTYPEGAEPDDMKCVMCHVVFSVEWQPFTHALKITARKIIMR
jgi:hypothetical protein